MSTQTSQQQQALVLRDGDGNFYLISAQMIQESRVPAEQHTALEKAISGQDVAGFFFGNTSNLAFLNQENNQSVVNAVIGGFVNANQTGLAIGSNNAAINQSRGGLSSLR
jgi:hypothetical protein